MPDSEHPSSGAVKTELNDHHKGTIRAEIEALDAKDIADGVAYMVTRPRHAAVGELWIMPTEQAGKV